MPKTVLPPAGNNMKQDLETQASWWNKQTVNTRKRNETGFYRGVTCVLYEKSEVIANQPADLFKKFQNITGHARSIL